jgi:hypothetical protein
MSSFHVYALRDSGAPDENRYIGGAYGRARRRFMPTASSGAKSSRQWIAEAEAAGRTVIRKILFTCADADEVRWAETATWEAYKAVGHRVQEDRPNAFSPKIAAAFAKAGWPNCKKAAAAYRSPETRARVVASMRAGLTPEAIKKAADTRRGQKRTPEARERMAAAKRGKKGVPRTPEWLANQSAARKGKALGPQSPEHVERRSASNRGKKRSAEIRLKLSTVTRAGWQRPEVRRAHAENQGNQYSGRGTLIARRADGFPLRASR